MAAVIKLLYKLKVEGPVVLVLKLLDVAFGHQSSQSTTVAHSVCGTKIIVID